MQLHGQFGRDADDQSLENHEPGSDIGILTETESLLAVAQEQASNLNSIRKIYYKDVAIKCRLCGPYVENILRIVSGCSILTLKDYKRRHGKVCLNIHWALYEK